MDEVVAKGVGHLTKVSLSIDRPHHHIMMPFARVIGFGEKQKEWELEVLPTAPPEERVQLVSRIESILLECLQQPHTGFNVSSIFFNHNQLQANWLVRGTVCQRLEAPVTSEESIREMRAEQSGLLLEAYAYYITVERRRQKPDQFMLKTLYERAIAEADKRRWEGDSVAEDALRSFWIGLVDFLKQQGVDDDLQLAALERAVRSVPAAGGVWARYMRFLFSIHWYATWNRSYEIPILQECITDPSEDDVGAEIRVAYEKMKTITPFQSDVEQLVPIVLARALYEKRQFEAGETGELCTCDSELTLTTDQGQQGFNTLSEVVMDGVTRLTLAASPSGDLRLRIEKFFSSVCLKLSDLAEHALILWEDTDTTKNYKMMYLALTSYTEVLVKQNVYEDAREETEKAQHAAMQLIAEQQANATSVSEIPPPASSQKEGEVVPMAVDSTKPSSTGAKRKAEDEVAPEEHKKQKIDELIPAKATLKRDRENCTDFVADLPSDAREDERASLFKDCGPIREIKVTRLPNALVATVEFMERQESVPAALTRDKKRIHGKEIAVHLTWKSTFLFSKRLKVAQEWITQWERKNGSGQAAQQQPTSYATDPRYPAAQQPFAAYPARGQSTMLQDPHDSRTLPPLNMPQRQAHAGAMNPSMMAGSHVRPPNNAYPTAYNLYTEHPQQPASYYPPPDPRNLPPPIPAMGIDPATGGIPRRASMSVDRTAPSWLSVHGTSPYPPIYGMASPSMYNQESSVSEPTVKKKQKRADPEQLKVLNETYNRTAFPSTEERVDLARRLNMSARSVQIWFQNKRQATRQAMRESSHQAFNTAPPTTSDPFLAAGSGPYGAHASGTATVPCSKTVTLSTSSLCTKTRRLLLQEGHDVSDLEDLPPYKSDSLLAHLSCIDPSAYSAEVTLAPATSPSSSNSPAQPSAALPSQTMTPAMTTSVAKEFAEVPKLAVDGSNYCIWLGHVQRAAGACDADDLLTHAADSSKADEVKLNKQMLNAITGKFTDSLFQKYLNVTECHGTLQSLPKRQGPGYKV
ncbi:uncharacterized protein LAESUDRAFT_757715 [Laetiporus sulphureus 93-53]|uniref:Homeobox domain-containing protein n=1 Tax=Laetiporus sulphureus 93-53 TaxID=1314785 RepID=A0A165F6F4_9APHY|nr:uncharacterized protein LAESUDRAFT_757715 [Laetiporus sulphureus 93-53]KZT08482.1 hypothetical protein LAESUDRAFT_757715 [Laetiporus sulphureus 93-53]